MAVNERSDSRCALSCCRAQVVIPGERSEGRGPRIRSLEGNEKVMHTSASRRKGVAQTGSPSLATTSSLLAGDDELFLVPGKRSLSYRPPTSISAVQADAAPSPAP